MCEIMKTEPFSFANCSGITDQQFAIVAQARRITAIACCVILLFVIILIVIIPICKRKKRVEPLKLCENVVKRLTIWLTAITLPYELFLAIYSIPHSFSHDACKAIGFLIQCFGSVQLLLTVGIGVALLIKVLVAIKPEWHLKITKEFTCCCCKCKINILEVVMLVLGFVLPLINLIIFATDSYGDAGPWCSITTFKKNCTIDLAGQLEQHYLRDIPFMFVLFLTLPLIFPLLCYVIRKGKDTRKIVSDSLLFLFFMTVLCVIEIPTYYVLPFVNRTLGVWLFFAVSIPIKGILIPTALMMAICLPISSMIAKCKNHNEVGGQGRTLSATTEHHSSDWSILNKPSETVFEPSHEDSEYARLVPDKEKQDYSGIM